MRVRGGRAGLLAAALACAAVASCSGKATQAGGLEVIVATANLQAGTDFDMIEVVVQQEASPGGKWNTVVDVPRRVPSEVKLPATVAIKAGTGSDQEARIFVTASKMGVALVERGAQVQVPTDRVAELVMVLSKLCAGQVTTCPDGRCEPDTGACGASIVVDPSTLPSYTPGDTNRVDAGTGLAPATDGGDAGEASVPGDAGGDSPAEAGTGAVATLGASCASPASLACAGHAQKVTLICSGSPLTWTENPPVCGSGQLCDSQPGPNQGTCAAVDPLCSGMTPGALVCSDATHVATCGPDLVSHVVSSTCTDQTCVAGSCTGVCASGQTRCSGSGVQTCLASGQWGSAAACPEACASGACTRFASCQAGGAG